MTLSILTISINLSVAFLGVMLNVVMLSIVVPQT
jgi:hypothetical protein